MDTSQWPQEAAIAETAAPPSASPAISERKIRTRNNYEHQRQLNCPRCNSSNTKFCYYNNYSLTQPRHFCKTCRRYWTEGGSLRNIPVGGGSRRNKRSGAADAATSSSSSAPAVVSTSSTRNYSHDDHFMHEVLGLGFQVGAAAGSSGASTADQAHDQAAGRFLFGSQNRGEGGSSDHLQGFWNW